MKRIVFITGTRAEYDIVVPVLKELAVKPGVRGEVPPARRNCRHSSATTSATSKPMAFRFSLAWSLS